MKNLARNFIGTKFTKFLTDYIFLLLMLVGIAVNFYFEMKVNKAIKKFTSNQEIITQYQQYVNQISQLNKKLDGLEGNVRNLALSGQKDFIKNFSTDALLINQESVIIADNIRPIVSSQNSIELRKSVQQRLAFESSLVEAYMQSGTPGIQKKLAADGVMKPRVKFNLYYSIINAKLQSEIMARNKVQDKDKLEIISLDYAIPHLTSFIFLVIAFFVLYKILQVYKLNENLNEAVQKEQEAQLIKEQFMDNMTHELRSPLNAVLGYTGLILKTPLKKDQEKFAKAIRTSGELLLNVINEVLDYAKIKSGYLHFANEPFSLKEQLVGLSDIVSDKLSEKGLNYETEIEENVPDNLRGDASKLLQVLLNITFNAIKFTSEGKIRISVDCIEKSTDRVKLKFSVSDTGIGIPAEKLPYIFDRFYQVQDNVAKKYGGTGLGLSITRQIVMLQGGSIHAESEVDKGTSFIFNLGFDIANDLSLSGQNKTGSGKINDRLKAVNKVLPGNMKILIVDDNALNRELACFILKDFRVKFKAAASGQEALDLLKNESFDVVLMDVQMPVLDGRETTRKIREVLKLSIPVIALTAFSQPSEKQRCLDAGMDAYLSKPVKEKELFEILEVFAPETLFTENLIDIHYLNGIATDNKEYIDTVILKIAETLPNEIAALRQAVEANDHELVNRLSHDMKTTFAILGLDDSLSEPIRFLESWNSTGKVSVKVKKMLELIESTGEKVITQIRENFSVDSIKN
jgi:signal transduction histidine kinase/DNA-binding NarL/FixJ family response regulator